MTIAAQTALVQAEMASRPAGLVRHVERVVAEAVALARAWDVDPERATLAAWGHDLFRAHSSEEQLALAREAGLRVTEVDEQSPVLLHGPLGAAVLRERFGVTDGEALAAVRDHTLGSTAMPMLAKVILLADKFEPRKRQRTPVMKLIRQLAARDIDLALLCWADWKWVSETEEGWRGHPDHWEARLEWVAQHHAEVGLPGRTPD